MFLLIAQSIDVISHVLARHLLYATIIPNTGWKSAVDKTDKYFSVRACAV